MTLALASVVLLAAAGCERNGKETGADLETVREDVYHQATGGTREQVPRDDQRAVNQGDTVDVASLGEGRLDFADGLIVSIFRDSELRIEGFAEEMSPIDRVRLNGGTLYADVSGATGYAEQFVVVTPGGAVITALGTEFLVHYNPTLALTWVIVTDGEVQVAAGGASRIVPAGWQIWVERGPTLSAPFPATRAIADWTYTRVNLPLLEDLGGPTLQDNAILNGPRCTVDLPPGVAAVVRDGAPFEAVARTADAAWVRDVSGFWVPATQLDCPYSVADLPIRSGPPPLQTPGPRTPTPADPVVDTPTPVTPGPTGPIIPTSPPDTTPPPAPVLTSPNDEEVQPCESENTVNLGWNPVTDESGISGYRWTLTWTVDDPDGSYTESRTEVTSQNSVTVTFDSTACGTRYELQVIAIDGANNQSASSAPIQFNINSAEG
jgi:hypothetical protein